MSKDRITRLVVEGMRSLDHVRLELQGLTILIGDNGSGKSSLLEVFEILRRAAGQNFYEELMQIHGGLESLLRVGADRLRIGIRIEGAGAPIDYEFVLSPTVRGGIVESERLYLEESATEGVAVIERAFGNTRVALANPEDDRPNTKFGGAVLAISRFGDFPPHPAIERVLETLREIELHVPFDIGPAWLYRSLRRTDDLRRDVSPAYASKLDRLGINLVNAYSTLHTEFGRAHWDETLDLVRLGLGDDIEEVITKTRRDTVGTHGLWIKYRCFDRTLPSSVLSDGMLAYLAFVAMYRLGVKSSLLAFDEPELHLHPHLLVRVLDFFRDLSRACPVVLATQSDRLLDALDAEEAGRSVVLCELDAERRTRLLRPDLVELSEWLHRYRGLGDLRSNGYERAVMTREASR